jgi:hypothetical protein
MKSEKFIKELGFIVSDDIKNFTKVALDNLPDYFYTAAASSTGRYHPSYALGEGGLVRHTKAATRFANHLLQLEQNQLLFNERERDMILSAIILHDGWKHGNAGSTFTTHEHPQVCADWVETSDIFNDVLPIEDRKEIATAISSHMGQWNTTKRSKVVLNKPETEMQKFVHMCDYLASRKDIEVLFYGEENNTPRVEADISTYKFTFGKYKGELITDVAKSHKEYLQWMSGNMKLNAPLDKFVAELLK